MSTVVGLAAPEAHSRAVVGGKAANLAELIDAGFAVPDGFCVTTAAYREVASTLVAVAPSDRRAALLQVPVPALVRDAIAAAYTQLGDDVPVAVRSSATAEDLPGASFAGQQDTFLNVVGVDAVVDAVRRCWASLWNERAVSYRAVAGIDSGGVGEVALAVVVQRMVDAQVAGVLFTADPVCGTRRTTVLDAAPGLGEAVVSGAVNPDHVRVDATGVIDYRPGDKTVEVRPVAGGGTELVTRAARTVERVLDDAQVRDLAALGRRVEAYFGSPQDIEWAIDTAGDVWLTQSRPITTLHPVPPPTGDGLRVYLCVSLAQGLTRPITPMGVAAFRVVGATGSRLGFGVPADELAGPQAMTVAGGRVFVDVTAGIRNVVGRRVLPKLLDVMESRSAVVLRALFAEPELSVRVRSPFSFLRRLARVLLRFRIPVTIGRAVVRPAAARRRIDRIGARIDTIDLLGPGATAPERVDRAREILRGVFPVLPTVAPAALAGFALLGAARALAGQALDAAAVNDVLRSLPYNGTTEMDLELWALAARIRSDPSSSAALADTPPVELAANYAAGALPAVVQGAVREFLDRHGHRAVAEIDLGMPRWRDDPTHVLGVLANYLRLTDPAQYPDAVFARGAAAADAAITAVGARVAVRSRWRAVAVTGLLRRMRGLAGLRETHKDYLIKLFAKARAELVLVGKDLVARGLLDEADDVFFLDLAELRTAALGADLRSTVVVRRAEYDGELRRRHVPRILLSDGTEPEAQAPAGPVEADGALRGTPASAGVVTGPARVVFDPVGAHLEPGEILVVPSTDPGWTPLFLTAGGLVMEMGGANSHGAVVAREYGIPAVVGLPDATSAIVTGEVITVDGGAGTVRRG